jgi:hypothetical protein
MTERGYLCALALLRNLIDFHNGKLIQDCDKVLDILLACLRAFEGREEQTRAVINCVCAFLLKTRDQNVRLQTGVQDVSNNYLY